MYSYQHRFHAGNFADIHKHITLIAILKYLHKKEPGFCVIDAFSGEGIYNLESKESSLNKEYQTGYRFLNELSKANVLFKELYNKAADNTYPGSPFVIQSELRKQDKAIFIENHRKSFEILSENFHNLAKSKNISIIKKDAYEAVNSLVPYKEKRGLVFFDPSYEVKTEYQKLAEFVCKNLKKNATGIYVIWYPLIAGKNYHKVLYNIFEKINISKDKIWVSEIFYKKNKIEGMHGSGMIVINMPWTVDKELEECFSILENKINE